MGEICVVPVESSWRDRNELLGYYNDFSKNSQQKSLLAICTAQAVRGTRIPSILLCLMR